jgi:hypothetical protein
LSSVTSGSPCKCSKAARQRRRGSDDRGGRPYFKVAWTIGSGGEVAPAHREPGLCGTAIEQEHEQQHRDGEPEWRLGESGKDAAQGYGKQDEQSRHRNRQVTNALCEQAHGTEQVVEIVKPLQNPFH